MVASFYGYGHSIDPNILEEPHYERTPPEYSNKVIFDYTSAEMMKKTFFRWLPAVVIMAVIFWFSSTPSTKLPSFGLLDFVVKKGGHMLGYGLLALAYWYGLRFQKRRWWLALLFAILYAISDEFHQSFVPGRHPSWVDVLGFDGGGALIALSLGKVWSVRKKRPLKTE